MKKPEKQTRQVEKDAGGVMSRRPRKLPFTPTTRAFYRGVDHIEDFFDGDDERVRYDRLRKILSGPRFFARARPAADEPTGEVHVFLSSRRLTRSNGGMFACVVVSPRMLHKLLRQQARVAETFTLQVAYNRRPDRQDRFDEYVIKDAIVMWALRCFDIDIVSEFALDMPS